MTEKKKIGRPKKYDIDTDKIEQLSGFGCTNVEISSFFGCSESTLTRNYGVFLTKGREKGKIRLSQLQWRAAEKGNTSMLIWLGKQILGQTDRTEVSWENPVGDVEFIDV